MSDDDPPLSVRVRSPFFAFLACALVVLIGLSVYRASTAIEAEFWLTDVYALAWWLTTFIVLYCIGFCLGIRSLRRLAHYFADIGGRL